MTFGPYYHYEMCQEMTPGAGEVAQMLRTLVSLPEDLGSIQAPT